MTASSGIRGCLVLVVGVFMGCAMFSAKVVNSESIKNIQVNQAASTNDGVRVRVKAILADSGCSIDKVTTEMQGVIFIIRVTERPVAFIAKDQIKGDIDLELLIPKEASEVRFLGATDAIWVRGK